MPCAADAGDHRTYSLLIAWVDAQHVPYRVIDHAPESRTGIKGT
jgi:hypothetical protein